MKGQIICSIKKDFMEYRRSKRNLLFSFTLFLICAMVLCSTKLLPALIDLLLKNAAHVISDVEKIETTLLTFFPEDLRRNMGVLGSDIIIFYGVVAILTTYNLVVKEIKEGKWIFPLGVGYKPFVLVFSKGVVYALGAAFPSVVFYNAYYLAGNTTLIANYQLQFALSNSIVLGFAVFFVVYFTIMLATIYKQPIMSAVTMILFVVLAPDIFSLFLFGKYLPTYILTHLYQSNSNFIELIIPMALVVVVGAVLTVVASKKLETISVAN